MNGIQIQFPDIPQGTDELDYLRNYRHMMLRREAERSDVGESKRDNDRKRELLVMKKINVRLYELTGNNMYIWLGGHYEELKKNKKK